MSKKWSTEQKVGLYEVTWVAKGKKYSQKISAGCEYTAARHARQVCHPGAYATIEVHFLGRTPVLRTDV